LPHFLDPLDRAAERGSGVTAKDEDKWLAANLLGDPDRSLSVQRNERHVGRGVTGL
jgi:hypothetical protein